MSNLPPGCHVSDIPGSCNSEYEYELLQFAETLEENIYLMTKSGELEDQTAIDEYKQEQINKFEKRF